MQTEDSIVIAKDIANLLLDKKAVDVLILEVSNLTAFFDCFVIASGESFVQLKALADYIDERMEENGLSLVNRKPSINEDPWILLDYGTIIIHLFLPETREYYGLEKLWFGANIIQVNGQQEN